MKSKHLLFLGFALATTVAANAQVQIDKQIQMNGASGFDKRITGVGNPSDSSDAVNAATIVGHRLNFASAFGSANSFAVFLPVAISGYTPGMLVTFIANNGNTGPVTLDVNSMGPISIVKNASNALVSGDITAGMIMSVVYDGTNFQVIGSIGLPTGFTGNLSGDVTGPQNATLIANDAVTTIKILDNNVTTAKIADNGVTTAKINAGAVTPAKLSTTGAVNGQSLMYNGVSAVWAANLPGGAAGGDLTGTYPNPTVAAGAITPAKISSTGATIGQSLIYNGATVVWGANAPGGAAGGDLTGTYPNPTVAAGAITPAKMNTAGAVNGQSLMYNGVAAVWAANVPGGAAGGDLSGTYPNPTVANNAITPAKINTTGATNGQVLTYNGAAATWATAAPGGSAGGDLTGTYPSPTIAPGVVTAAKISSTGAASGQVLGYNGVSVTWMAAGGTPSGAAGGDLTGTYPNPTVANAAITPTKISSTGASSGQVLTYNGAAVAWTTPANTPGGAAGGDLTGTYPNPTVAAGAITPAKLSSAGASAGQSIIYNGAAVVWAANAPGGAAGGDLAGTYPNPTIAATAASGADVIAAVNTAAAATINAARLQNTVTIQGNTFNGASQLVQTTAAGFLPALNGSLLTNVAPGGAAGGDLTGTYPNPTVATNAITTAKHADSSVTAIKIKSASVATVHIIDASVTAAKMSSAGASSGQVLTYNGAAVAWATPSSSPGGAAGGDLTGTYPNPTIANTASTGLNVITAVNSATSGTINAVRLQSTVTVQGNTFNAANQLVQLNASGNLPALNGSLLTGVLPSGSAGGDLTGTYPNPTIANSAVTTAKISSSGATSGQVLAYNGASVAWTDLSGPTFPTVVDNSGGAAVNFSASTTARTFVINRSGGAATTVSVTLPAAGSFAAGSHIFITFVNTSGGGNNTLNLQASGVTNCFTQSGVFSISASAVAIGTANTFSFVTNGVSWYKVL